MGVPTQALDFFETRISSIVEESSYPGEYEVTLSDVPDSSLSTGGPEAVLNIFDAEDADRPRICRMREWTARTGTVLSRCKLDFDSGYTIADVKVNDIVQSNISAYDWGKMSDKVDALECTCYPVSSVIETQTEFDNFVTLGEKNVSVFFKANTYTANDHFRFLDSNHLIFDRKNGGVSINFGSSYSLKGDANYTDIYEANASVVANTNYITVGAGQDLSDIAASPADYLLCSDGQTYQVQSADNSAKTITVDSYFPAAWTNRRIFCCKNYSSNFFAEGLLTIRNMSAKPEMLGLLHSDMQDFTLNVGNNAIIAFRLCDVDLGKLIFKGAGNSVANFTNSGGGEMVRIQGLGARWKVTMTNCYANDSSNQIALWALYSRDLNLDINLQGGHNVGSGNLIAFEGYDSYKSTARGQIDDFDTISGTITGWYWAVI